MIVPEQLEAGAHELIERCLGVAADERVLILTDEHTLPLAWVIRDAATARAATEVVLLPPVDDDPERAIANAIAAIERRSPHVTIFAAKDAHDRFAWDEGFQTVRATRGIRHAHMPALDEDCLGIGMATDYGRLAEFTRVVHDHVTGSREVTIVDQLGTDIRLDLDPGRPWTGFDGLYHQPGEGGRLPQGEVFCSPLSADGAIAAAVLGYPFNAETGLLEHPVLFEVHEGRMTGIEHPDSALCQRLEDWFDSGPNGRRIGELAFGTNRDSRHIVGNLLFDENVPGCHIAFGHPFGDYTGADWIADIHVDVVLRRPTITVDGIPLIIEGAYPTPHPEEDSS